MRSCACNARFENLVNFRKIGKAAATKRLVAATFAIARKFTGSTLPEHIRRMTKKLF